MKVLVAIDGSESALRALGYMFDHQDFFSTNPELVLINVHLPLPPPRANSLLGSETYAQIYKEESEEALAPARELLVGMPCRVVERQVVGQPAALIVAAAIQEGCDLIVMGTHGRNALGHLLMGPVAMRVIAASPVPVLSVKYESLATTAQTQSDGGQCKNILTSCQRIERILQFTGRLYVQGEQRNVNFNLAPTSRVQIDTSSWRTGSVGEFGNARQAAIADFHDASGTPGGDHMSVRRYRRLAEPALCFAGIWPAPDRNRVALPPEDARHPQAPRGKTPAVHLPVAPNQIDTARPALQLVDC